MKFIKFIAAASLFICSTPVMAEYAWNLKTCNLAPTIEEWVKNAEIEGTYAALPQEIKESWQKMKQGVYTCSYKELRAITREVMNYLRIKQGVHTLSF